MPEMDGFETCKRIKQNPKHADVPVVFLTAKNDIESIVTGFQAGGVDYIAKPYDPMELRTRISTHLGLALSKMALRNAHQELQAKSEQLEKANATKNMFFKLIAHDLRGPLGTAQNSLQMLLNSFTNQLDPDLLELTNIAQNCSQRAITILDQLLNWALSESGEVTAHKTTFNLHDSAKEVIDTLQPVAKSKGIEICFQCNPNAELFADANMIQTTIRNILANAIKFSHKKSKIDISIEPQETNTTIVIQDHGVGITQGQIPLLFDLAKKKSTNGTQGERGTGLGLILCKSFVENNSGTIVITSAPNQGTRICLNFPTNIAAQSKNSGRNQ